MEARVKLVKLQDNFRQDLTPEVCKTFKAELQSIARRECTLYMIHSVMQNSCELWIFNAISFCILCTGEVSAECSDEADLLCLEYFRAQEAVKVANAILGYVTSTNTTTSAIAGIHAVMLWW